MGWSVEEVIQWLSKNFFPRLQFINQYIGSYTNNALFQNSLLRLDPSDLNKMALECFACIMRYMGDLGLLKNQTEVDCVNTILVSSIYQQNHYVTIYDNERNFIKTVWW